MKFPKLLWRFSFSRSQLPPHKNSPSSTAPSQPISKTGHGAFNGKPSVLYSSGSGTYGALSLYSPTVFGTTYSAIYFQIEGDQLNSKVTVGISDTTTDTSYSFPLANCITETTKTGAWTMALCDISKASTANNYNRLYFQDSTGSGLTFHLADVYLGMLPAKYPAFTAGTIIGSNTLVMFGNGVPENITSISFISDVYPKTTLSYVPTKTQVYNDVYPRTYFYLNLTNIGSTLKNGNYTIGTTGGNFNVEIGNGGQTFVLDYTSTWPIADDIYGMAFTPNGAYAKKYGVTVNRWGGNDRTCYNPNGEFTNAAADWYYTNRDVGLTSKQFLANAVSWGVKSFFSLSALDWVAKDKSSGSYPLTVYPNQEKSVNGFGNGKFPNGTKIVADPTTAYTPWNLSLATTFVKSMATQPSYVAIDNEMDIADGTHYDIHPNPPTYDELLNGRYVPYAKMVKSVFPKAMVVGPSSCCWNSGAGAADKAKYNYLDFIPWFLQELKKMEPQTGRILDSLDVHIYPGDGVSANKDDPELRMRITRSWWDPTYKDESWFGDVVVSNQTNGGYPQYIPRFKKIIKQYYPGTKFGIGEWSLGNENHVSTGLAIADTLGIFGREMVDWATYWTSPPDDSMAGLGFWLFRGNTSFAFPSYGLNFTYKTTPNFDTWGAYAGVTEPGAKNATLVLINKSAKSSYVNPIGLPSGVYHVRHFSDVSKTAMNWGEIEISGAVVVPPYTAMLLRPISAAPAFNGPFVPVYGQCGGTYYQGSTYCVAGTVCKFVSSFYSQCVPTSSSTTTTTTTTATSPSPSPTANCQPKNAQCGGKTYTGAKCCASGSTCTVVSEWYSQCK
ncbi:hypothetical protein HK098_008163 [Nowakowskiella sp. JEL0407]|nr:hypothetical protein HK098_008163 [Nowakowskiella sp. JEL0407]